MEANKLRHEAKKYHGPLIDPGPAELVETVLELDTWSNNAMEEARRRPHQVEPSYNGSH